MTSEISTSHPLPSYLNPNDLGAWGIYLQQIDRVTPYLGSLSRWVETLKRPKRSLIVDVPVELDNGTIAHFESNIHGQLFRNRLNFRLYRNQRRQGF